MFIKKKLEIIQAISQKLIRDLAKNCYINSILMMFLKLDFRFIIFFFDERF